MNAGSNRHADDSSDDSERSVHSAAYWFTIGSAPSATPIAARCAFGDPQGGLNLANARQASAAMAEIGESGFNIDQGMVVKLGGRLYYGSDAIHALAVVSSRSGLFNKLNCYLFRSHILSRILYSGLRTSRNLHLKATGKTKINNLRIEGTGCF